MHAELFDSLPSSVRLVRFTFVSVNQMGAHFRLGADSDWEEFDTTFTSNAFQARHSNMVLEIDLSRAREVLKPERHSALRQQLEEGLPRMRDRGKLAIYSHDPEMSSSRDWWGKERPCIFLSNE